MLILHNFTEIPLLMLEDQRIKITQCFPFLPQRRVISLINFPTLKMKIQTFKSNLTKQNFHSNNNQSPKNHNKNKNQSKAM